MRILFMGTPDFAVPCLKILIENGHGVCGAVTQPDKPKGRVTNLWLRPLRFVPRVTGFRFFSRRA